MPQFTAGDKVKVGSGKEVKNLTKLNQTTSGAYTQAEVQAIATKVDAIITALQLKME